MCSVVTSVVITQYSTAARQLVTPAFLRHDGAHRTPRHANARPPPLQTTFVPAPRPVPCERCSKHAEYVANTTVSRPKRRACHSTLQLSPTTERGDSPSGAHIAGARLGLVTKRRPEVPHECTQVYSRWLWRAVERQRMTRCAAWPTRGSYVPDVRSRPSDQHSA